jgi:hypothetical protein
VERKIENVLTAIRILVDDRSLRWEEKKEMVLDRVHENNDLESSLQEFVAWFEGEFE